jgi:hypothetical protein
LIHHKPGNLQPLEGVILKLVLAICALLPGLAAAQGHPVCMPAGEMDAGLFEDYGERVIAEAADGTLALWRNEATGSWTIVEYQANGLACALEAGDRWPPEPTPPALLALLAP